MILVPFIADGVPPTISGLDMDSGAGELSESSGFAELLALFAAAVEPVETQELALSKEVETLDAALGNGGIELAPAPRDVAQGSQEDDEVLNDVPALVSLLAPPTIIIEAGESPAINVEEDRCDSDGKLFADDPFEQGAEEVSPAPLAAGLPIITVANLLPRESTATPTDGVGDPGGIQQGSIHEAHRTEQDNFANLPPRQSMEPPAPVNRPFQPQPKEAAIVVDEPFSPDDPAVVLQAKKPAQRAEPNREMAPLSSPIVTSVGAAELSTSVFTSGNASEPVENQTLIPTNHPPSRVIDESQIESPKVVDKTQPIAAATAVSVDPIISVKSADAPVMVNAAPIAYDRGLVTPPPANQNKQESPTDGQRREEIESLTVQHEFAIGESKDSQFNTHTDSHSQLPQRDARPLSQDGDFKLSKDRLEPAETEIRPTVPDRAHTVNAPLPHRENISAAANPTAWRSVIDRVAAEIIGHGQIGKHQAVLQLDPPELGKIKIDLWVEGEEIHARIVADEQSTKTLIETHLAELQQALDVGRVELVNLRVDHVDQHAPARGGEQWAPGFDDGAPQGQRHGQSRGGLAERNSTDGAPSENPTRAPSDTGRISMWA